MTVFRILPIIGLLLWGGITVANGQEFVQEMPTETRVAPAPEDFSDEFTRTGPPATGGIISAAIKAGNPIVLINPLAPEYYGDGRQFVSQDPETGDPKGLKVVEVTW